jgi:hypothetical protein
MPKPFMGPPREEWKAWTCGYSPPGAIGCTRDVTWHGVALDETSETDAGGMGSCDEHLPQMRLSADYVHPHQHPCGVPDSMFRWPENECYLDWDGAELLTLAAAEPVSA